MVFIAGCTGAFALSTQDINRTKYYEVYASSAADDITALLSNLDGSTSDINALRGALLMKKSGVIKNKREQLSLFKQGKVLLDNEIRNNPTNAEYRFLRITIQENAPKILGYNKDIEQDKAILENSYKMLSSTVKKAISDYAKTSNILKGKIFN